MNASVICYLYILFLVCFFTNVLCNLHYLNDYNYIIIVLYMGTITFYYSFSHIKSIIVDYVNNECSQVLLISLLSIFFSNLIIYLALTL